MSAGEGQEDPTKVSVLEGPEGLTLYRRGGRKKFARLLRLRELPGGDPSRKALYGFLAGGDWPKFMGMGWIILWADAS